MHALGNTTITAPWCIDLFNSDVLPPLCTRFVRSFTECTKSLLFIQAILVSKGRYYLQRSVHDFVCLRFLEMGLLVYQATRTHVHNGDQRKPS